jgi:uncharacterized protein YciI
MSEYIYLIHPFREGFFTHPNAEEEKAMQDHFAYLQKATQAGTLLLAGPCLDDTFGVVIFRAASEADAQAFMANDPSVKANVMMAELHPLRVSLRGA